MATFRTGGHWGITIIREGTQPPDERGRRADDQLVAVTMNDPELAERICELLNALVRPGEMEIGRREPGDTDVWFRRPDGTAEPGDFTGEVI